jgi:formylmethanofuran:tetrahydromethanopterin formyltransferase
VPKILIAAAGVLMCAVFACSNPSSGGAPTGPTVSSVSVQQGDVPSGMVKCPLSGNIEDFIKAEQTPDPNTATSITNYWTDAQSNGAKTAYAAIFADSQDRCSSIKNPQTDVGTATYKLVVNFVVEFKDEATATDAYNNKTIFGFSKSQLKAAPVIEGTKTGLTENSIVLSQAIASQQFYIAEWQNKKFMVILAVLNIDPEASKKVSTAENSRIK